MSLRLKTILIVLSTLCGLLVILWAASSRIFLSSFALLEEKDVRRNVSRVINLISDDLDTMGGSAGDWSFWDDTYQFIQDMNESYVAKNLQGDTFKELRANLMLYFDTAGRLRYGKGYDFMADHDMPVPESIKRVLIPGHPLLVHPNPESIVQGLLLLPEGPLLVVSRPITRSERINPIMGTFVMGRFLDDRQVQRIAKATHLTVAFKPFAALKQDDDWRLAKVRLAKPEEMFILPGQSEVSGFASLQDLYGHPALLLKVSQEREIYQQGRQSVRYFMLLIVLVGLIFGLLNLGLLERTVLSRLTRLSISVKHIRESGDLATRVGMGGADEIAGLAGGMDGMLEELERARNELVHHRDHLEELVAERTNALRQSNEQLKEEMRVRETTEQALRDSERKYRRLFEEIMHGVIIMSAGGTLVDINPAGVTLLGFPSKEALLSAGVTTGTFISDAQRRSILERIVKHGYVKDLDLIVQRPDGKELVLSISAAPERDDQQRILSYHAVFMDVTERRTMERRLFQMEKLESIGTLAGGIAHDFNNILTSILMNNGYAKLQMRKEDRLFHFLDSVEEAGNLGAELTTKLLAFSRGGTSKIEPVNMNKVVDDILLIVQRTFSKLIVIEKKLAADLPFIEADVAQMGQVLMNLCINARDAMGNSEGKLNVATGLADIGEAELAMHPKAHQGRYVIVAVADTGGGMTREIMNRIFEPFFTTKGEGKGTGLGLAVVYGIIKAHRGFIDVASQPGAGTTFTVYLPLKPAPAPELKGA